MNIDLISKVFRSLVFLSFLSILIILFVDMSYIESQYDLSPMFEEANTSVLDEMGVFALIYGLLGLVTYPLLFFYTKWSRELFTLTILISFFIDLLDASLGGYTLANYVLTVFGTYFMFVDGLIVAIAYFSPLKDKFK